MQAAPATYWRDYLFCTILGWGAFFMAGGEISAWLRALYLVVAALALYRSAIFIHEIVHLRRDSVPGFRAVWNLFSGVPLLIPSFFYEGVHLSHHRVNFYGTEGDGEYFPFGRKSRGFLAIFFLGNLLFPMVLIFRHLVLTPLSLVSGSVKTWTWRHFSSLEVNFSYSRPIPASGVKTTPEEFLAFLLCASSALALYLRLISPHWILVWYTMAALLLSMNALRTLAAHRYRFEGNSKVSSLDQYLDSIDIPGNFLTALWAPVGLRFHATHHLFPGLPYHSLGLAHRRLNEGLVENLATYQRATCPSLWRAIRDLWKSPRHPLMIGDEHAILIGK